MSSGAFSALFMTRRHKRTAVHAIPYPNNEGQAGDVMSYPNALLEKQSVANQAKAP